MPGESVYTRLMFKIVRICLHFTSFFVKNNVSSITRRACPNFFLNAVSNN